MTTCIVFTLTSDIHPDGATLVDIAPAEGAVEAALVLCLVAYREFTLIVTPPKVTEEESSTGLVRLG